jgi:hypothetical protein
VGFQLPITIVDAVKKVQTGDLVLPAIQREFVWEEPQIIRLFDSVLRVIPLVHSYPGRSRPKPWATFAFTVSLEIIMRKTTPTVLCLTFLLTARLQQCSTGSSA